MAYKSKGTKSIRNLNKWLVTKKQEVANAIAARAATTISAMALASFNSRQTVYGDARPEGKHGPLSLFDTGKARDSLVFTADGGSKIRAVLAAEYVRFLIGKYRILPIGNAAIPYKWTEAINRIGAEEIDADFKRNAGAA